MARASLILLLVVTLTACSRSNVSAAPPGESKAQAAPAEHAALPHVDGQRAYQFTKDLTDFGPRWPGTPAHEKMERYILEHLKGVDVEQDKFTARTPVGQLPGDNIIAKFAGAKDGIIVVAGHYDTLYGRKDFVGANDGGSSAGLLLELVQQLKGKKLDGYSVWLVWTDNEEAVKQWSDRDQTYGARQLAAKWNMQGVISKIKAFILLDMIGDSDLGVDREDNSTPWLEDLIAKAASDLGYSQYIFARKTGPVEDDHLPFSKLGVPVADLIDFSYGPNNSYWHSSQDTMAHVSAQSLEIVGSTVLRAIHLLSTP